MNFLSYVFCDRMVPPSTKPSISRHVVTENNFCGGESSLLFRTHFTHISISIRFFPRFSNHWLEFYFYFLFLFPSCPITQILWPHENSVCCSSLIIRFSKENYFGNRPIYGQPKWLALPPGSTGVCWLKSQPWHYLPGRMSEDLKLWQVNTGNTF